MHLYFKTAVTEKKERFSEWLEIFRGAHRSAIFTKLYNFARAYFHHKITQTTRKIHSKSWERKYSPHWTRRSTTQKILLGSKQSYGRLRNQALTFRNIRKLNNSLHTLLTKCGLTEALCIPHGADSPVSQGGNQTYAIPKFDVVFFFFWQNSSFLRKDSTLDHRYEIWK